MNSLFDVSHDSFSVPMLSSFEARPQTLQRRLRATIASCVAAKLGYLSLKDNSIGGQLLPAPTYMFDFQTLKTHLDAAVSSTVDRLHAFAVIL